MLIILWLYSTEQRIPLGICNPFSVTVPISGWALAHSKPRSALSGHKFNDESFCSGSRRTAHKHFHPKLPPSKAVMSQSSAKKIPKLDLNCFSLVSGRVEPSGDPKMPGPCNAHRWALLATHLSTSSAGFSFLRLFGAGSSPSPFNNRFLSRSCRHQPTTPETHTKGGRGENPLGQAAFPQPQGENGAPCMMGAGLTSLRNHLLEQFKILGVQKMQTFQTFSS